jgi:hypothetical protein
MMMSYVLEFCDDDLELTVVHQAVSLNDFIKAMYHQDVYRIVSFCKVFGPCTIDVVRVDNVWVFVRRGVWYRLCDSSVLRGDFTLEYPCLDVIVDQLKYIEFRTLVLLLIQYHYVNVRRCRSC